MCRVSVGYSGDVSGEGLDVSSEALERNVGYCFLIKNQKSPKLPRKRIYVLLKIILLGLHGKFIFLLITWFGPPHLFLCM